MSTTIMIYEHCVALELMPESGCRETPARALEAPPIGRTRRNLLLPRGRAMTFAPPGDTQLRLTRGRLWITFEAPPKGLAPRNGDHFVVAGDRFDLLVGEVAVLEAIGPAPAALFYLEPAPILPSRAAAPPVRTNPRPAIAQVVRGVRSLLAARTAES